MARAGLERLEPPASVVARLVPATSNIEAERKSDRGGRVNPRIKSADGHDGSKSGSI
jgi:hypothetical protein